MAQVRQLSFPHPGLGGLSQDSLGLENLSCNSIHHSVLSTNVDCYLPTSTILSSFLTLSFIGTFSHNLFPSSINFFANVMKSYRRNLVPTDPVGSQINQKSLLWAFMGNPWNETLSMCPLLSSLVLNSMEAEELWDCPYWAPPFQRIVTILKHVTQTPDRDMRSWAERQREL